MALQGTDELLVSRSSTQYKVTWSDFETGVVDAFDTSAWGTSISDMASDGVADGTDTSTQFAPTNFGSLPTLP